jgi:hypothetical protein
VSFIGYLRPLVKGRPSPDLVYRRPIAFLALGFTASAFAVFTLVSLTGRALFGRMQATPVPVLLAAAVLCLLALIDLGVFGLRTPMWRRQTPRSLYHRFGPVGGALLWGLDTGLVVTTFRVTSLSWAALALTALGLLPWWTGLLYAAGFTLPAAALVLAVPAPPWSEEGIQEPVWLQYRLAEIAPVVRRVALVAMLAGAGAVGASALWSLV